MRAEIMNSDHQHPDEDLPGPPPKITDPPQEDSVPAPLVGLAIAFMALIFAALLFLPAGRLDWTLGWIYVVGLVACLVINCVCLSLWNPELIARRMRTRRAMRRWNTATRST